MSYTTLYGAPKKGELEILQEYKNSHGSAPAIWSHLSQKHLGQRHLFGDEEYKKLWALQDDARLEEYEKTALVATFDNCMIKTKDLPRVIDAFEKVYAATQNPQYINHLSAIAGDLKTVDAKQYAAVCFCWTSVCGDAWYSYDKEEFRNTKTGEIKEMDSEESRLYDLSKDTKHWFLFED
jgi:hypothetical protein